MARSRKAQIDAQPTLEVTTAESGINVIMDTPLEKTIDEAAEALGIDPFRLQELFVERLGFEEPMTWLTIPTEHESLLADIKRGLESEASVRRFDAPVEPTAQLPQVAEEEPTPKSSKGKGGKLTERKTQTIEKATEDAEKLNTGIVKAEQLLRAQKGAKNGAKLASIELLAEESAYNQVKGAALKRKVAVLVNELADEEGFDPAELLKEVGLDSIPDTLQDLMEEITPALGKLDEGTQEVIQTSWVNGLHIDLSHLNSLLNSKD